MFYVGGHEGRCEYFAAGPALRECFDAGDIAASGDVIVSQAVWTEVKDVSQCKPLTDNFYSLLSMEKTFRKRSVNRMSRPVGALSPSALRALRSYAPPLLLSAHNLDASLNHQSARGWTVAVVQTSVLFVNLGIGGFMDTVTLDCLKIHTAVVTVQRIVQALQGCIHRFTVDDKGCVMKVVFGAHLPHEDQPYRALLAALQLRQALSLQGIQPAVGVASGESLIGPVGSAMRQEFTVHGDKVILAARLMQLAAKYGGMVLCDDSTFLATRDDLRFVRLRSVQLKGKSASIRPNRPVASSELLEKPALSAKQHDNFSSSLEPIRKVQELCNSWLFDADPVFHTVIVTGQHGSGKTQLLMQARACFEQSCRVLHVRCREHEGAQRGALLRRIFAQLCGHDVWPSLQHLTPMMASHGDPGAALLEYELKLLLSHAAAPVAAQADGIQLAGSIEAERGERGPNSSQQRLGACQDQERASRLSLIIDDIHHADAHSCELLQGLAREAPTNLILFLTCREPRVSLSAPTSVSADENHYSPGHRLVHDISSAERTPGPATVLSFHLRPLGATGCKDMACAELGVKFIPKEVADLLTRRSGGSPLLCQSIVRNLVQRGALRVIQDGDCCQLQPSATDRTLNNAATESLVTARHSVLCVKIAELSLLQQLVLKAMSLLPEPCSQSLLLQALPVQTDAIALAAQLRLLREKHLIAVPQSHRRSLPGVLSQSSSESEYSFVDVGMREVCQHLMVDAQKRQIRLRVAAANESKQVLGSLADSISSSFGADELARSLSPNMLRASKLRSPNRPSPLKDTTRSSESETGSVQEESFNKCSTADEDSHWWLSRSLSSRSPASHRGKLHGAPKPSPSRLHARLRRDNSPASSRLSSSRSGRLGISQLPVSTGSPSFAKLSPNLQSWNSPAQRSGSSRSNLNRPAATASARKLDAQRHRTRLVRYLRRFKTPWTTQSAPTSWQGSSPPPLGMLKDNGGTLPAKDRLAYLVGVLGCRRWSRVRPEAMRSSFQASEPKIDTLLQAPELPDLAEYDGARTPPRRSISPGSTSPERQVEAASVLSTPDMPHASPLLKRHEVLALSVENQRMSTSTATNGSELDSASRYRPSAARRLFVDT